MKKVIGMGVMLKTPTGTYLLQERDMNAKLYPGMIAPFGGGVESGETIEECAVREIKEELNFDIDDKALEAIKLFEIKNEPGSFIQMFLLGNVDKTKLVLLEGESIVEISKEAALDDTRVTDFTKEVLGLL